MSSHHAAEPHDRTDDLPPAQDRDPLRAALDVFDRLLDHAVRHQAARLGPESLIDPWRGMHLDGEEIHRLLAGAEPTTFTDQPDIAAILARAALAAPAIARMAALLRLQPLDIAVVMVALAPEVDARYERIYAYLNDDIARKRPTTGLLANLLCCDRHARIELLSRLGPRGPLRRLHVLDAGSHSDLPLPSRPIVLDPLWRNRLLNCDELDERLVEHARIVVPDAAEAALAAFNPAAAATVEAAIRSARSGSGDMRFLLVGPHGAGKYALARTMAAQLGLILLVLDVRDLAHAGEVAATVQRATRASVVQGALLYVHGMARLQQRDPQLVRTLTDMLATSQAWFVLAIATPLPTLHGEPLRALRIDLDFPQPAAGAALWREALARNDVRAQPEAIDTVVLRFTLSAAQIAQAAEDLRRPATEGGPRAVDTNDVARAARALCGGELAQLARRIAPRASLSTVVATAEAQAQLQEICARVALRVKVRRDWTRDCVHARNEGVTALFVGPSGTGKSLAAEAIAGELGFDLFRIDLAAVVSKYIGETEKNLDRVFAAAEYANAVLLFDEADALFGKRSEVKDAHDRYANIEIAYLLQKMEQFDGLAILATNLKQNLDDALPRRLTFTVNFAFPEEAERRRLWEALWPPHAPRADEIDFGWFAYEYALSGGNIRNAVLAALHLAAADGSVVRNEHLLHAVRREFQKLGKNLPRRVIDTERRAQ